MTAMLPPFYMVLLIGAILLGLILIATGIALLLKIKNILPGGLAVAIGVVFATFPILILMAVQITPLIHS